MGTDPVCPHLFLSHGSCVADAQMAPTLRKDLKGRAIVTAVSAIAACALFYGALAVLAV